MLFDVKPLRDTDYEDILLGWWEAWGWEPPKKDFLPDNGKGGLCVFEDTTPICAGFLYTTNSNVAWVDWIISNKEYRKKPHRQQAIGLLIETLTNIAKKTGHKYSYALIKHRGLIDTYKNLGYIEADKYTTEMIKVF
jgi:hypothetical protein